MAYEVIAVAVFLHHRDRFGSWLQHVGVAGRERNDRNACADIDIGPSFLPCRLLCS